MPLMVTRTKIGTMPVFLHGSSDCLLVFPRSIVWKTSHPISNSHACNRRNIGALCTLDYGGKALLLLRFS